MLPTRRAKPLQKVAKPHFLESRPHQTLLLETVMPSLLRLFLEIPIPIIILIALFVH